MEISEIKELQITTATSPLYITSCAVPATNVVTPFKYLTILMLTAAKVLNFYGRLQYFYNLKNLLQVNIDFNDIFYVFSTLNRVFGTQ